MSCVCSLCNFKVIIYICIIVLIVHTLLLKQYPYDFIADEFLSNNQQAISKFTFFNVPVLSPTIKYTSLYA